mmetsp:Transcript_30211/g.59324  ORF Transcript_30211/g.59324 Transcript_30211/m.59324 type:complete len:87 (+) Transcript_30211:107-367(+)
MSAVPESEEGLEKREGKRTKREMLQFTPGRKEKIMKMNRDITSRHREREREREREGNPHVLKERFFSGRKTNPRRINDRDSENWFV